MGSGSNIQKLGSTINDMAKGHVKVQTSWATVAAVDWVNKTMTAIGVTDELPYYGVQLGTGSFYRKPAIGSMCLIGIIENQDAATILIDAENVEEAIYTSGPSQCTIKQTGFIVQRDGESFKAVLNDFQTEVGKLCEELMKVIVLVGTGPNTANIAAIKDRVTGELMDRVDTIFAE